MKHTFFAFSLLLAGFSTQAQFKHSRFDDSDSLTQVIIASDTLTPRKGEKQLTFALADNSGFFMFKKYCSPKFATRFGFSGGYNIANQSFPQSSGPSSEQKYRNFNFQLSFGLQRSFGNFKRFEPYTGMDLGIGNRMESTTTTNYNVSNGIGLAPTDVIETKQERKIYFSPSASLTPLVGFNYYIAERFALGAEYRVPLVNFYMVSNSKSTVTRKLANGTSETQEFKDADYASVNGNFRGIAYVTATIFFNGHCKK